jgi:hypothetical protein
MYSLEYIKALQDESTLKAKAEGLEPYIARCDKDENVLRCPDLGYYLPDGWDRSELYFVDNSGFGSESEPALTINQFLNKVKQGFGYAIYEAGQFQVYIQEYKKV